MKRHLQHREDGTIAWCGRLVDPEAKPTQPLCGDCKKRDAHWKDGEAWRRARRAVKPSPTVSHEEPPTVTFDELMVIAKRLDMVRQT